MKTTSRPRWEDTPCQLFIVSDAANVECQTAVKSIPPSLSHAITVVNLRNIPREQWPMIKGVPTLRTVSYVHKRPMVKLFLGLKRVCDWWNSVGPEQALGGISKNLLMAQRVRQVGETYFLPTERTQRDSVHISSSAVADPTLCMTEKQFMETMLGKDVAGQTEAAARDAMQRDFETSGVKPTEEPHVLPSEADVQKLMRQMNMGPESDAPMMKSRMHQDATKARGAKARVSDADVQRMLGMDMNGFNY
jgi:hypothetical protein